MTKIRVAFRVSPDMRMTREIMEEALAAQGIAVTGEPEADVLIVRADNCDEAEIRDLLAERPQMRVLAMAAGCDGGEFYELCLRRGRIGSVSPRALTERIAALATADDFEGRPLVIEGRS